MIESMEQIKGKRDIEEIKRECHLECAKMGDVYFQTRLSQDKLDKGYAFLLKLNDEAAKLLKEQKHETQPVPEMKRKRGRPRKEVVQ